LEGDLVDDLDDLGHLVAGGADLVHGGDHLAEGGVALSDALMDLIYLVGHELGVFRILAGHAGDLLGRRSRGPKALLNLHRCP